MNKQKNNSNKDNFLKQYWNNFFKYVTMGAISADLLMNISLNYSALKKHDSLQEIPLRIEYMINELENSEKLNYEELNYEESENSLYEIIKDFKQIYRNDKGSFGFVNSEDSKYIVEPLENLLDDSKNLNRSAEISTF